MFIGSERATWREMDRELEIDLTPDPGLRVRLHAWDHPGGFAVRHHRDGVWAAGAGLFDLPLPVLEDGYGPDHPVRRFLETIPEEIRRRVRPLAPECQLTALRLLSAVAPARELQESAPNLFWLAVDRLQRAGLEPDPALWQRKRKAILGWILEEDATPAQLRLAGILRPLLRDRREAELCRAVLRRPALVAALRHARAVGMAALELILRRGELASACFFREQLAPAGDGELLRAAKAIDTLWRDTLQLGEQLGVENAAVLASACPTLARLRRLHDRWMERYNARHPRAPAPPRPVVAAVPPEETPFPPPPLPGNETIQPLPSAAALRDEGREMGHCVGVYDRRVRSGELYIYRVLAPERATVAIALEAGAPVKIVQFKLTRNRPPSEASWQAVRQWLTEASRLRHDSGHCVGPTGPK